MSTVADESEPELLREVPDSLHKLIRLIVRGFYGVEHGLVVDVLVRNACVKEEDIQHGIFNFVDSKTPIWNRCLVHTKDSTNLTQELLKFDKKYLRSMLVTLKNDKLLKTKLCCLETEEGKVLRHNYYYINYRSISNIIKYKLHHILKKIETQERDSTNRAAFKCPQCQNTYTDLDVNYLMDPMTGTLQCTFCKSEVEEDVSNEVARDSRTLQAKFNEQMDTIYKMLKSTENIRLSLEVLEPEPMHIHHLHPDAKQNTSRQRPTGGRHPGSGHWTDKQGAALDYDQEVTINIGDDQPTEKVVAKETPIWIQKSTIKGSSAAAVDSISERTSNADDKRKSADDDRQDNNEVIQMLLMQEGSKNQNAAPATATRQHSDRSDSSDDDNDDFDDVDENDPAVTVAGRLYRYSDVALQGQSLVQLMTAEEKKAYIEIGQQMYDDMEH